MRRAPQDRFNYRHAFFLDERTKAIADLIAYRERLHRPQIWLAWEWRTFRLIIGMN